MAREALDQAAGAEIVEAFLLERRGQRAQPGSSSLIATVRIMAPNTSQAGGAFSSASCGQPRRAPPDEPAVDPHRVGPVEG